MGGGNFFKDRTVQGVKFVPLAGLDENGVTRLGPDAFAFQLDFEVSVEQLKGFLFDLVKMVRMLLARQLDDQLLAILAIVTI